MNKSLSVAELLARGVELRPFEAVAIARALIQADPAGVDLVTPVGPPSLSTVLLEKNGTVFCCSCGITPSVSEIAILLSDMLRQSGTKMGGGLRYAIARALLEVDAPPFDSVADFSRALQRYERGEHTHVIRALWARADSSRRPSDVSGLPHPDRRRRMPSATELRRQLRQADRRLYELLTARDAADLRAARMNESMSVAELLARGVELRPFEAVAIARALVQADPAAVVMTPVGPPSLSTVRLEENGTVFCCGCGITPSVSEVAMLLSDMLRQSGTKVGGGLRYAIARALMEVDAPPFDSVADFARALQRYQQGDHSDVIHALWARTNGSRRASEATALPHPDRRRRMPSATELRRQLREADRRLYELLTARDAAHAERPTHARPFRHWIAGAALACLALIVVTGPVMSRRASLRTDGRPSDPPVLIAIPPSTVVDEAVATGASRESVPITGANETPPAETGSATSRSSANDFRASNNAGNARAVSRRRPGAIVPAEAPSVIRALDGDRPMFSPSFASDGTAMFFHTGRTADPRSALMSVRDLGGAKPVAGDLRVVTILEDGAKNYHAQPSPDGTRIAFDSDRDGERGVYIAESDGTNVRRISGPGYAAIPTWAAEGDRLAFIRAEPDRPRVWNLWLYSLSTSEMVRVTSFRFGQAWGASWFPDGQRICYSHEDRLFVHDLEAGRSHQYATPIPGRLVRTPAVSPDGQRVIFQVERHGAWLLDLSDGSMRVVLTDPTAEEFAWSPDGRRVAFHSKRNGGWGIWFTAGS